MQNNKLIVLFLLKFFGMYALLYLIYAFYLQQTQKTTAVFSCAPITQKVASQTKYVLEKFGYDAKIEQNKSAVSINLYVNDMDVARIIEGCNSISIIILFISFIVAFSGKFITTTLYILFGSLLIYGVNIVRIAIISIALYKYPAYQFVLHDIAFPVIIYGLTFLLWFVWVKQFSKNNE